MPSVGSITTDGSGLTCVDDDVGERTVKSNKRFVKAPDTAMLLASERMKIL